jgi:hypothetical protein
MYGKSFDIEPLFWILMLKLICRTDKITMSEILSESGVSSCFVLSSALDKSISYLDINTQKIIGLSFFSAAYQQKPELFNEN